MRRQMLYRAAFCVCAASVTTFVWGQPLPGTAPLVGTNDVPAAYLEGLDRLMLRETGRLAGERQRYWKRDFGSGRLGYVASVEANRQRLARLLGVRDARVPFDAPEPVATLERSAVLGETATHTLMEIRWPVLKGFCAEGLLLEPKDKPVRQSIVHMPHAGVTPEQVLGLAPGGPADGAGFSFPSPGCRMVLPDGVVRRFQRGRGEDGVDAVSVQFRFL